jgi:hypothetical protein
MPSFQRTRSHLEALSDESTGPIDSRSRQVLAESSRFERASELLFPEANIFEGIGVDRFVGAAVDLSIGLVISLEVHARKRDRSRDR